MENIFDLFAAEEEARAAEERVKIEAEQKAYDALSDDEKAALTKAYEERYAGCDDEPEDEPEDDEDDDWYGGED